MKINQLFFRGLLVFLMLGCYSTLAQNRGVGNDFCENAQEIQCGFVVNGSTTGQTFDDVGFCGTSNTAAGVWYKFEGEGSTIVASTCNNADYDTKISIFSGSDCFSLNCETGNDDGVGCSGFSSETAEVDTVVGTTYFILVHGFGTATGNFTLTLTCTDPPQPLENDLCPDAISLACGDSVTGSTEDATTTGQPGFCDFSVTAPGVWYTIEGTGGMITLDTCGSDYDTKLSVYEGVCGNLDCVVGNDDDESFFDPSGLQICGGPNFQSSLEFQSTAGTTYYVYVHGFASSTGDFVLNVDCACFVTIDSGDCQTVYLGAEGFAPDSADLSAVGFGTGALMYEWSDGQTGEDITVSPTETTVYTVTLTDDAGCTSTAETTVVVVDADCDNNPNNDKILICHNGETICVSPNAVQAHIDNHGDTIGPCDQLNCDTRPGCTSVTDPADGSTVTDPDVVITWDAAPGYVQGYRISIGTSPGGSDVVNNQDVGNVLSYDPSDLDSDTTYYVTVTPYNDNGSALSCPESSFTTDFTPANDLCADAITVACGDTVNGDTSFANADGSIQFCGTSLNTAPGVWYRFVGTGDDISVTTCSPNTDYDTKLGVFSGDCNSLICVGGDDDDFSCPNSGLQSVVEFTSIAGEVYNIYVTGFSSASGNFELSLTCTAPPVNEQGSDDCANAVAIACGDTFSGTTTGFSDSGVDCSFNFGAPGVWYKFDGTGDTVIVNTCGAGTNYDTKLDVFSGDCGSLTCEGGNDDFCGLQSQVTFATSVGTSYYIYVNGFLGSGDYELSVTCIPAPAANPEGLTDLVPWSLSPNPSIGTVDLNLERFLNSDVTIDVLDLTGKVLETHNLKELQNPKYRMQLNSNMDNGLYLIRLSSAQHTSAKRLILNR